jgi:hypothetical protein
MDAYDYYKNYCVCPGTSFFQGMRDLDGEETSCWPVSVYNVNEELIGVAYNKSEYVSTWNSDEANQAVGVLSKGNGPFGFNLLVNYGQVPPFWVIGVGACGGEEIGIYGLEYGLEYQ